MEWALLICAVIVTIAVVVTAVSVVRLSKRLSNVSEEIQLWLVQMRQVTGETREVMTSLRGIVQPVQRVVDRFEQLGEATARMTASLLEEVEAPVRTVVALTRGVRTGTSQFLGRLTSRFRHGRAATDGGIRYE
jgi:uncharacterized protein YoxC